MNVSALMTLSKRFWLVSTALAVVLAVADFSGRLVLSGSDSPGDSLLERAVPMIKWPKLSLVEASEVYEAYRQFDPAPPVVAEPIAPPPEKPAVKLPSIAEQQGELKQLILDRTRYELMAVVAPTSQEAYALIKSTHTESGSSKVERYENGADLKGLVLTIDSLTQVRFHATPELMEREGIDTAFEPIILMMYNR